MGMNHLKRMKAIKFLLMIALFFVVSAVVMWLWNAILPEVIGVKRIDYLQATGIFCLSRLLFGGFGFRYARDKCGYMGTPDRFRNMTESEKERFKEMWKKRFC
jgi:hypothetical protein